MSEPNARELALTVPADPRHLATIRAVAVSAAEAAGFDAADAERIALAVDEAISNVIRHSYRGEPKPVTVRCLLGSDALEIRVRDFGPKPDQAILGGRDLAEVRPGGLGVPLIRQIMDEVEYDLSPEVGTELRMLKRLRSSS